MSSWVLVLTSKISNSGSLRRMYFISRCPTTFLPMLLWGRRVGFFDFGSSSKNILFTFTQIASLVELLTLEWKWLWDWFLPGYADRISRFLGSHCLFEASSSVPLLFYSVLTLLLTNSWKNASCLAVEGRWLQWSCLIIYLDKATSEFSLKSWLGVWFLIRLTSQISSKSFILSSGWKLLWGCCLEWFDFGCVFSLGMQ